MTPNHLAIAVVTCLLGLSSAANALSGRFVGGGTLSNFNRACLDVGWSGDIEQYSVRYHPRAVASNPERDSLSFFSPNNAFSVQIDGAGFTSGWQSVNHVYLGRAIGASWQGDSNASQVRILSRSPASVTDTTAGPVRIRGQIRHFGHARGCVVEFNLLVQQRQ